MLNTLSTSGNLDTRGGKTLDTPKNRQFFISGYKTDIRDEFQGRKIGGYKSWESYWQMRYKALRSGHNEAGEYYINYIKKRRKELGLPRN